MESIYFILEKENLELSKFVTNDELLVAEILKMADTFRSPPVISHFLSVG